VCAPRFDQRLRQGEDPRSGSHTTPPQKHFASCDDLLAAVSTTDFAAMKDTWRQIRRSRDQVGGRLVSVLDVAIRFAHDHPARYRLLFNSPELASREGPLRLAAEGALNEFTAIIEEEQAAGSLPPAPSNHLAVVLFATVHGLIDADAAVRGPVAQLVPAVQRQEDSEDVHLTERAVDAGRQPDSSAPWTGPDVKVDPRSDACRDGVHAAVISHGHGCGPNGDGRRRRGEPVTPAHPCASRRTTVLV